MKRNPDGIVSRSLAGVIGGFITANVVSIAFKALLSSTEIDAVMTAMLASFAIYTGAVIWAFTAKSSVVAWQGLVVSSGVALFIWLGATLL